MISHQLQMAGTKPTSLHRPDPLRPQHRVNLSPAPHRVQYLCPVHTPGLLVLWHHSYGISWCQKEDYGLLLADWTNRRHTPELGEHIKNLLNQKLWGGEGGACITAVRRIQPCSTSPQSANSFWHHQCRLLTPPPALIMSGLRPTGKLIFFFFFLLLTQICSIIQGWGAIWCGNVALEIFFISSWDCTRNRPSRG